VFLPFLRQSFAKNHYFTLEIQDPEQVLRGLAPSRFSGRKTAFRSGNSSVKRIVGIVKILDNFPYRRNPNLRKGTRYYWTSCWASCRMSRGVTFSAPIMADVIFESSDLSATDSLGRLLAESLPDGSVIALIGTLGAGKTKLVQAIAKYTGNAEETISSPTFVLLHEYEGGDRPIYHFDAYRLETAEEFQRLSPDDYFEGVGLTFVEWADKFPQILPTNHLEIRIEPFGETTRRFRLIGHGAEYAAVVRSLG